MKNPKLTIELVPKSCWYSNVRSNVKKWQWDTIRKTVYRIAGYKCEICGGKGNKWPVECHEVWDYDELNGIQKLVRMIALCPDCHMVKHIGLAQIKGNYSKARSHLAKINQWSVAEAEEYIRSCFIIWQRRNTLKWELDLSYLKQMFEFADKKL